MSRIYFHSKDEDAEVRGAERAHMGCLLDRVFVAALDLHGFGAETHWLRRFIPQDSYVHKSANFGDSASLWVRGLGSETRLVVGDKKLACFDMCLNTAMACGSDELRLCAILHGQCEMHAWVAGENRSWLASLIESALELNIFRQGMGWPEAVALLRKSDSGPVVCSYSVCEQFPNAGVANFQSKTGDGDDWYELSESQRWQMAMRALRDQRQTPEMRPDNWASRRFGHCKSAFDLRRIADDEAAAALKGAST